MSDAPQAGLSAYWRRHWLLLTKVSVSIVLVAYLFSKVDIPGIVDRIQDVPLANIGLALLLILLQSAVSAVRWFAVVRAIGHFLRFADAMRITFVSLFFNQFLPASVGADLVRMWQSKRAGLPLSIAVSSVMLERFGNLFCIVAMASLTMFAWARHIGGPGMRRGLILIGLASLIGLAVLLAFDLLAKRWRQWRAIDAAATLSRSARQLFFHPLNALVLLVTAVGGQILLAAAVLMLAIGLGLDVGMIDCLILMPPVVLISSLPISVAGWGVREFAMVTAFGMIGVNAESALALSIVLALTATIAALPGGVLWALHRSDV